MLKCKVCEWECIAEVIAAREMMYGTREEFECFVCLYADVCKLKKYRWIWDDIVKGDCAYSTSCFS